MEFNLIAYKYLPDEFIHHIHYYVKFGTLCIQIDKADWEEIYLYGTIKRVSTETTYTHDEIDMSEHPAELISRYVHLIAKHHKTISKTIILEKELWDLQTKLSNYKAFNELLYSIY